MKPTWTLGVLLLVVFIFGAYLNSQCFGPPSEFEQAVDTFKVRDEQAAKDSVRWSAVVDSARSEANRSAQDADSLRKEARRQMNIALALASRRGAPQTTASRQEPHETVSRDTSAGDSLVARAALESALVSYNLMVKAAAQDSITIAKLNKRIRADSIYIQSLERVRAAGQRVVATKPGRSWLGCRYGASALIALNGQASAGLGVTCGL